MDSKQSKTDEKDRSTGQSGLGRRTFLGAAAALATLPATGAASSADAPEWDGPKDGAANRRQAKHTDVWACFRPTQFPHGPNAEVTINAEWLDDEPGVVEWIIDDECGEFGLAFDPERARQIAEDLMQAAADAEDGPGGA